MPGRVDLVFERKFGAFGQRGVENVRIGFGQQQSGRVAIGIARDLAAERLGRVFRVADRPQRRAVQDRAVIEMQQEHRRIRCDRVEFIDRR
jgi:hypothetical protein